MNDLGLGLRSSLGTKYVMALTGVALLLFALAHMAGNLLVFAGRDALNDYAAGMKDLGPLLWVMRAGLLGILVAHVGSAVLLTRRNQAARPVAYDVHQPLASSYASRTMLMSGLIVAAFVAFHLLHLTLGVTHPEHFQLRDNLGRQDVYSMVVLGFRQVPVTATYLVAMVFLGFHLKHGIASLFQSLGLNAPRYRTAVTWLGRGIALLIVVGNCSMPLAALCGLLPLPQGVSPLAGG